MKLIDITESDEMTNLISAMSVWCTNTSATTRAQWDLIRKAAGTYLYTGKLFRVVMVYDEGNINNAADLKKHVVKKHRKLSSWSKSLQGIDNWNPWDPEYPNERAEGEAELFADSEYVTGHEKRILDVLCTTKGRGLDVEMFYNAISKQPDINQQHLGKIQQAAHAHEVIMFEPIHELRVEIKGEHTIDFDPEARKELQQWHAEEQERYKDNPHDNPDNSWTLFNKKDQTPHTK